jgi:uncharacterized protein with PQ loop repeat
MSKSNSAKIVIVDRVMYFMAIAMPILTSSQVLKIWVYKKADGVSMLAWAAYAVNSLLWIYYGKLHKKVPIIFTNLICFVINVMVVIGTIIYG